MRLGDEDERDGRGRVLRLRITVRVAHLFDVAVIRRDDECRAFAERGARQPAEAAVEDVRGLDRRGPHAGVAHHVGIRVVRDDEVVFMPAEGLDERVRDRTGAHLGREVVGRHLAVRWHEDPFLAWERLLDPAVEEVRDVRVFLRLGNVELPLPEPRQVRRERVDHERREGDRYRELVGRLVLGQGRHFDGTATATVEPVEVRLRERVGQLPSPVGPEVHVDDRVSGLHRRGVGDEGGQDELVALVAGIRAGDRR